MSRPPEVRCAIYCRKSTDENLSLEFNSLDAQREACEAFIASHKHEGWTCLPDRYDEGGYSGGNLDRPALQRLLKDIADGKVDVVLTYKVDRLTRSLTDFARIVEVFETHKISFVAVTQQINTSCSMGRLMLNVLLSFAQFERELVSERTRDKIAAARRRGKWSGGRPLLGYDIVPGPGGSKLSVNESEAEQVRQIFDLYLDHEALIPVVRILNERGWTTKRWTTRKDRPMGGHAFDKSRLYQLLTNVTYIGKVRYKTEVHEGEHDSIVSPEAFKHVQALLQRNGRSGGAEVRNRYGALLKGLIRCTACDCAMSHSYTTKGARRYRYYTCQRAQKSGWENCSSKSVPAEEIERFVVDRIRELVQDPSLIAETIDEAQKQAREAIRELEVDRKAQHREQRRLIAEIRKAAGDASDHAIDRMADLQQSQQDIERRLNEIDAQIAMLRNEFIDESSAAEALRKFDPVWEQLAPRERVRIVRLLVERVDYDGANSKVAITFHAAGLRDLITSSTTEEAA